MPTDNAFRHQVYTERPPRGSYQLATPAGPTDGVAGESCFGDRLGAAGVQRIVVAHGTFTGNDAWGLARSLEWIDPRAGLVIRKLGIELVDRTAKDVGNYSTAFVDRFQQLLAPHHAAIEIERFVWSGENHHFGRADAAVQLIDRLLNAPEDESRHFLLWGHSHAGNVFALATNLLAGPPAAVRKFFRAARPMYSSSNVLRADRERWRRVRQSLLQQRARSESLKLDIVTFGTPIRYGWERRGYRKLLHWVHHRPDPALPLYRVPFPFAMDDLRNAKHGDYVQQVGIAGTDFLPGWFTWRAWRSEKRLSRLLASRMRRRDTLRRLKTGTRVADDGTTLLVDYPADENHSRDRLFGHGIYTTLDWLPYHLSHVIDYLYPDGE